MSFMSPEFRSALGWYVATLSGHRAGLTEAADAPYVPFVPDALSPLLVSGFCFSVLTFCWIVSKTFWSTSRRKGFEFVSTVGCRGETNSSQTDAAA